MHEKYSLIKKYPQLLANLVGDYAKKSTLDKHHEKAKTAVKSEIKIIITLKDKREQNIRINFYQLFLQLTQIIYYARSISLGFNVDLVASIKKYKTSIEHFDRLLSARIKTDNTSQFEIPILQLYEKLMSVQIMIWGKDFEQARSKLIETMLSFLEYRVRRMHSEHDAPLHQFSHLFALYNHLLVNAFKKLNLTDPAKVVENSLFYACIIHQLPECKKNQKVILESKLPRLKKAINKSHDNFIDHSNNTIDDLLRLYLIKLKRIKTNLMDSTILLAILNICKGTDNNVIEIIEGKYQRASEDLLNLSNNLIQLRFKIAFFLENKVDDNTHKKLYFVNLLDLLIKHQILLLQSYGVNDINIETNHFDNIINLCSDKNIYIDELFMLAPASLSTFESLFPSIHFLIKRHAKEIVIWIIKCIQNKGHEAEMPELDQLINKVLSLTLCHKTYDFLKLLISSCYCLYITSHLSEKGLLLDVKKVLNIMSLTKDQLLVFELAYKKIDALYKRHHECLKGCASAPQSPTQLQYINLLLKLIKLNKKQDNQTLNATYKSAHVFFSTINHKLEMGYDNLELTYFFINELKYITCRNENLHLTGEFYDILIEAYNSIAIRTNGVVRLETNKERITMQQDLIKHSERNKCRKVKKSLKEKKKKNRSRNNLVTLNLNNNPKNNASMNKLNTEEKVITGNASSFHWIKPLSKVSKSDHVVNVKKDLLKCNTNTIKVSKKEKALTLSPLSKSFESKIESLDDLICFSITSKTIKNIESQQSIMAHCARFNRFNSINDYSTSVEYLPLNGIELGATHITSILHKNNIRHYIIGGYPRDKLFNRYCHTQFTPNDIDFLSFANFNDLYTLLYNELEKAQLAKVKAIFGKHPHLEITFNNSMKYDINTINKRLDIDHYVHLKQYLSKCDLTINALALHPSGLVIDFFNSIKHIKKYKLLTISPVNLSFEEDPIRCLRYFSQYQKIKQIRGPQAQKVFNYAKSFILQFKKLLIDNSLLKMRFYTFFIRYMLNKDIINRHNFWLENNLYVLLYPKNPMGEILNTINLTVKLVDIIIENGACLFVEFVEAFLLYGLTFNLVSYDTTDQLLIKQLAQQHNISPHVSKQQFMIKIIKQLHHECVSFIQYNKRVTQTARAKKWLSFAAKKTLRYINFNIRQYNHQPNFFRQHKIPLTDENQLDITIEQALFNK